MEESSFEIDPVQLAEASRLFPAHRLSPLGDSGDGVSSLAAVPSGYFARHAWDEAGTL